MEYQIQYMMTYFLTACEDQSDTNLFLVKAQFSSPQLITVIVYVDLVRTKEEQIIISDIHLPIIRVAYMYVTVDIIDGSNK